MIVSLAAAQVVVDSGLLYGLVAGWMPVQNVCKLRQQLLLVFHLPSRLPIEVVVVPVVVVAVVDVELAWFKSTT